MIVKRSKSMLNMCFMHIGKEQIERLAKLSLLELTGEEISRYTKEFNTLIEYFEKLNELDTSQIPPTYHVVPPRNVFREDEIGESLPREELLKVVPFHEDGAIKVPKIIEESQTQESPTQGSSTRGSPTQES